MKPLRFLKDGRAAESWVGKAGKSPGKGLGVEPTFMAC